MDTPQELIDRSVPDMMERDTQKKTDEEFQQWEDAEEAEHSVMSTEDLPRDTADIDVQHDADAETYWQLRDAVLEKHSMGSNEKLALAEVRDRILLLAALRGLVLSSPEQLAIDADVQQAYTDLVQHKLKVCRSSGMVL